MGNRAHRIPDRLPPKADDQKALVDFLVEASFSEQREESTSKGVTPEPARPPPVTRPAQCWELYVDDATSKAGSGAGILLVALEQTEFEKALRFDFPATNNQAEYEAVIAGLEFALDIGVKAITAYSDSQLVVNQVRGEYGVVNPTLVKYCFATRNLLPRFEFYEMIQID